MAINEVQGTQQSQPTRRVEVKKDGHGNDVNCIWEDRNGDGKLDLYSITERPITYDGCKHEITYFDNDGDGYFDVKHEKVTGLTNKEVTEEFKTKSEATKMDNILNPKKSKINVRDHISEKTLKEAEEATKAVPKKSVTEDDLKGIGDKRPNEAVDMLMEKSPVGKKLPSDDELAKMGYKKQPYMTSNGDTFYGNNLVITTHILNPPKGAVKKATYKVGRFEQVMYYDKDNNLIKGDFKVMDDIEGKYPEAHFGIWRNENGGYSYIN